MRLGIVNGESADAASGGARLPPARDWRRRRRP